MRKLTNDELPEGWVEVALRDIASWGSGGTPSRKNQSYFGGDIPWIKTGELDSGLILQTEEHLTREGLKNSSAKVFPKGAVAVAMYGATIGKASILGIDAATNQACAVAIPDTTLTTRHYLFHYLRSQKESFIQAGKGGAQPNISQGVIKEWPFPLAPLAEQKRIADKLEAVLERVDACRARLDRVPDLLKRFRQSVLAAATSGRLTKAIDEDIPKGWTKIPFEELLADKDKLSYGVLKPGDNDIDGVAMYRVVDIGNWGKQNETQPSYISKTLSREFTRTVVEEGDILLSVMATIGRAMVATKDMAGSNVNRALAVIKPDRAKVDSLFLMYYFLSPALVTEFEERSLGSAQVRINLGDLRKFIINLPPLAEQKEIVRRVDALFAFADRIEARLAEGRAQVERLTPATLAKAFRGELVPQDPNDEPASTLLERLRTQPAAPGLPRNGRKVHAPTPTEAPEAAPRRATVAPTAPHSHEPRPAAVALAARPKAPAVAPAPASPTPVTDLDKNDWMSLLREVLTAHGPCDRETVIQQAAYALDYQRAGRVVAAEIDNAIRAAVRRRVLLHEGHELRVNRASIAGMEVEDRDFMKDQFLAAISQDGRLWIDREEAARRYALWFGFRRTGSQIQDRVKSLINGLLRDLRLESEGPCIRRL